MSGKSALLRQTALITLMAHTGSFVPAAEARISLTDKIFTRVGASDNLSGGESTFMVEMNETASIINNITGRSLILLDEIGRGTSTYDGISIAWSIAEHLHNSPHQPKTLFATHYHELNELEDKFPRVKIIMSPIKKWGIRSFFCANWPVAAVPIVLVYMWLKWPGCPVFDWPGKWNTKTFGEYPWNRKGRKYGWKIKGISAPKMQLSIFDAHSETFDEIRKLLEELISTGWPRWKLCSNCRK